ncbi:TetR/AcrR family transcriptional regulator [Novosphingobium sp.]|uniref:TetR/AcrR family transcriptional regulator n=1 Tax=Novosphingobium sp. TaxID=1874826 RepID=UPI003B52ED40
MGTPKPSYHRENLKEDLLAAAFAYVEDQGHDDLSVRKLAQVVGVSPGAPYHHFPDRRSLLIAVAMEGYKILTEDAMREAQLHLEGAEILYRVCMSFLRFAQKHRRLMELMYESELTRPVLDPAILKAQQSGYQVFRNAMKLAGPHLPQEDFGACLATVWSAMYGFALMRDRQMIQPHDEISEDQSDAAADAIVRQAIRLVIVR